MSRQRQERDVVRCLESLNWLAGRRDQSEHEGTKPGATQLLFKQEVQARVRKLVCGRCSGASAIPLSHAAFRELLGSRSVHGPDENGNLANFSTVELVSLPGSLSGCPRLCDVVPERLRHHLENIQSMIKSKAELENMHPLPAAYWDPVLKRNRAKRIKLFARLLEIGLLRPRPKETAKYVLGIFFVNKKDKKTETSDPGCPHCEFGICVSARSVEEGTWESALESIELSLGMGDIQDCLHRYILDNEFASYFLGGHCVCK